MSVSLAKQITQLNTAHKPTVFVIALNSTQLLQRCQAQFEQAPYQALPKTPVIYVLPEATHNRSGANVSLPAGKNSSEWNRTWRWCLVEIPHEFVWNRRCTTYQVICR